MTPDGRWRLAGAGRGPRQVAARAHQLDPALDLLRGLARDVGPGAGGPATRWPWPPVRRSGTCPPQRIARRHRRLTRLRPACAPRARHQPRHAGHQVVPPAAARRRGSVGGTLERASSRLARPPPRTARPREEAIPEVEPPSTEELEAIQRHLVTLPGQEGAGRHGRRRARCRSSCVAPAAGPDLTYAAMPRWDADTWPERWRPCAPACSTRAPGRRCC